MPLQLIITAEHTTDLLAEVKTLATAIGLQTVDVVTPTVCTSPDKADLPLVPQADPIKEPEVKKMSGKQQDAEVIRMIETGTCDDATFNLLTKTRKKKVEEGIEAKMLEAENIANGVEPETVVEADVDSMFDDEPDAVVKEVIDITTIRDLMGKLGKNADGKANQDNLIKIKAILTKFVPEGAPTKLGNIPEETFEAVRDELLKI